MFRNELKSERVATGKEGVLGRRGYAMAQSSHCSKRALIICAACVRPSGHRASIRCVREPKKSCYFGRLRTNRVWLPVLFQLKVTNVSILEYIRGLILIVSKFIPQFRVPIFTID